RIGKFQDCRRGQAVMDHDVLHGVVAMILDEDLASGWLIEPNHAACDPFDADLRILLADERLGGAGATRGGTTLPRKSDTRWRGDGRHRHSWAGLTDWHQRGPRAGLADRLHRSAGRKFVGNRRRLGANQRIESGGHW